MVIIQEGTMLSGFILKNFRMRKVGGVLLLALPCLCYAQGEADKAQALSQEALEKARNYNLQIEIPEYEDKERVESIANTGRNRGLEYFERYAKQKRAELQEDGGQEKEPISGTLVLAVSSSMPEAMIRDYMRQLDGVPGAVVVMRGFIGGANKVKPTAAWIEKNRRKEEDCQTCGHYNVGFAVDPLVYRQLNILEVPALTYLDGVMELQHCDAEILEAASVIYGAVSIEAALKALRRDRVDVPDSLIARFEPQGWESGDE